MFILSQIHLSFSLSPCFSPSLFPPAEGPTAWMRCWVHGNWVSIDWTAAWPMGARGWEQQHRLRLSSPILQKNIHAAQLKVQGKKQNIVGFFGGEMQAHPSTLCSLLFVEMEDVSSALAVSSSAWVHHLSRPDCHILLWCRHWRRSCHVSVPG